MWRQVNECELKRDIRIGIVEKAQERCSDSNMHNTVCLCHHVAVLHGQWMCFGNTHITGNNLIPISVPTL